MNELVPEHTDEFWGFTVSPMEGKLLTTTFALDVNSAEQEPLATRILNKPDVDKVPVGRLIKPPVPATIPPIMELLLSSINW